MKPDPEKVNAILKMEEPKDVKSLQRFLGMINYLGKFCQNLSNHTNILRELEVIGVNWNWQERHQE